MTPEALIEAGEYRREVHASLARVWENVFDWEHLPALHEHSFATVELLDLDRAGWRIAITPQGGDASNRQVLKLDADRAEGAYRVRTEAGPGVGAEIFTTLTHVGAERTAVQVRFLLPGGDPERTQKLGQRLAGAYARLWDEDERMMQRREAMLRGHRTAPPGELDLGELDLGKVDAVREGAPYTVDWSGRPVRIAVVEGALVAFSAVCPHWLGPLDETPILDGCVRCPWHGYCFDVRTGMSVDGRGLRLQPAYAVAVAEGRARLAVAGPDHG